MKKILSLSIILAMLAVLSVSVFAAAGDNVAPNATVEAPLCSSWEHPEAVNDGVVPTASSEANAGDAVRYGSWGMAETNYETIAYTWDSEVTVDSVGIFFAIDVESREAWFESSGLHIPASYTIQYWNGTEYVDVTNGSGYGIELDTMNVTTFDEVTTTSIQITMVKCSDEELEALIAATGATTEEFIGYYGLGVYEIEVYETGETEPTEETKAPQTGVAIIALAIATLASGAYVVSKKR